MSSAAEETKDDKDIKATEETKAEEETPEAKKQKMSTPQSPDSEWPEAWVMADGEVADQKAANRQTPNVPATVEMLRALGIQYWKMDADTFTYPVKAVPWDPKDALDPRLKSIRDDRGYSYADIISIRPDLLPGYDDKVKAFFEEHIHNAEEIRYILDGSGYFDVRDTSDKWVRIHIKKGDLMTLPEGIYHRFTCDETDYIKAMRLFIGEPIWTPFNRPQEDHPSRAKYVKDYVEEKKE
uniref:Acireductone dioxygenase n=1 Tax=Craspedostauros australis TaxID=1486917 RepID=A0A7R9WWZ5_9STRA|mmetsp:Transcript_2544/g.7061  ORF Transcript_2544/g.7061 Transcript_2544/m.7061 type:complete len:239 (+) Transcript_2544:187-903(+)|eukprot:CAMPEP_0198114412 /NCGR_PEP_ID=MMETSP1442-20131203/5805_1 /TAXON_ID= /ORGANISM="Craspedostauros australis, Strain CCMP3328" /LENGTH=238 /DNA_ID=CAMNT_0043771719 /DNA_START=160 /DNA_END=876 /DNA_ORIENTATION=-